MRVDNEKVTSVEKIAEARAATGRLLNTFKVNTPEWLEVAEAYVRLRNLEATKTSYGPKISIEDLR